VYAVSAGTLSWLVFFLFFRLEDDEDNGEGTAVLVG
jgi:hypothetical protein